MEDGQIAGIGDLGSTEGPVDLGTEPVLSEPVFANRIATLATNEWQFWGGQTYDATSHLVTAGHKEGEDGYYQRVGQYWVEGTSTHGIDGRNHDWPWSAAFISFIMRHGGAGTRFRYSIQHSVYVSQSIRDRLHVRSEAGYWGFRLNELKPSVGDVVCWSRESGVDYDHQKSGNYEGHCDIVINVGPSDILVIGGNVGDSVTKRPIALDSAGFVVPATQGGEYLFAIMQNRIL